MRPLPTKNNKPWTAVETTWLERAGIASGWGPLPVDCPLYQTRGYDATRTKYDRVRAAARRAMLDNIPVYEDTGPVTPEPPTRNDLPHTPPHEKEEPTDVAQLLEAVRRHRYGAGLEELCDHLEWHPERLKSVVAQAKTEGYAVDIAGSVVGKPPAEVHSPMPESHVPID
jgi:hypothetical protein